MLTIEEIEEILSYYRLPPPKHILIIDDIVMGLDNGRLMLLLGATHADNPDTIALTRLATDETVIHEVLHTLGLGELLAHVGGRILVQKYRIAKLLGLPPVREVKYRECRYPSEPCSLVKAHQYPQIRHYILTSNK